MIYQRRNKLQMWYKVQELTEQGYNKSQIHRKTGLDRATVRKYQTMGEEEFHSWIRKSRHLPKKLQSYVIYVKTILTKAPYLSAAQVEDRLKEHYTELPNVHSKTVYNLVQSVRKQYDIPKPTATPPRQFEKLPEPDYGYESQVDFGETWMQTKQGGRKKVYFFAMVLSRSRYKYIYLQDKPFTTKASVEAHQLAFEYFAGVPRKIIYDQDSVFINDENLGDYKLTKEFSSFCKSQLFKAVFCRKSDPQSKGKIENVVKYVKQNFLRGREYVNISILNTEALAWLSRTANAKVHSSTKLIPQKEWEKEKEYLLPMRPKHAGKELKSYNVRKDNTVVFSGNFYTLPLGTYTDGDSKVLLEATEEKIIIYTLKDDFICSHNRSYDKGQTISNTDHRREKSKTQEILHKQAFEFLGGDENAEAYLQAFHKDKIRYYRDNLQYLLQHKKDYTTSVIKASLLFCVENKVFNAKSLIEIMDKYQREEQAEDLNQSGIKPVTSSTKQKEDIDVEKSDINQYQDIFE